MDQIPEILLQPAVLWFLIGLCFLSLEFVLPGLIVLFFGIGCWVSSIALLINENLGLNIQLIIFLVSSILALVLLRKSLKKWIEKIKKTNANDLEEFIGKHCEAESDFNKGVEGKVTFKGAIWKAHSEKKVNKGDTVIIKSVKSIHLIVEPI